MKNRIVALLLVLSMLLVLCACGGDATTESNTQTSSEEPSAAPSETAEATESPVASQDQSVASVVESTVEPESETTSVTYPIPGNHNFSMLSVLRMNAAEALGDGNYTDTPPYKAIAEATGVTLDMTLLAESTYSEQMNLVMASGDLPDFFSQTAAQYDTNMLAGIEDGILIDMSDMMEENAPNYKALLDSDPSFAAGVCNSDGSISQFCGRSIPRVSQGLLIRGDWLEELNMEAPTNLDELTEVLRAFHSEKGATMSLLVNFECDSGLAPFFNTSFMGFRGITYQRSEPNGDELICSYTSEGFIDYLMYLNSLYEEGLITDDFMNTGKEYGNWESSYYSGKCGVWQDDCKYTDPAFRENASDPDWRAVPFALTDIDVHVTQPMVVAMSGKLFLTAACDEPEAAMQFVNYAYTPEGMDLVAFGAEGVSWERDNNGEVQFTDIITNNPDGLSMDIALVYYTPAQWLPTDQQERYLELTLAPEAVEAYELWTEAYGDDTMCIPSDCTLDADDMTEFYSLASDVLTAVTEAASRVVIGDLSEEDYRQVIEDCRASGLDRMDEIYQNTYDQYIAG